MKYYILFTICFTSISLFGFSQSKGYYSIGNNAEKLKIKGDKKSLDSFLRVEKGYYNIETNREKLKRHTGVNSVYRRRTPEVKKGYYSIGNNVEKLYIHKD